MRYPALIVMFLFIFLLNAGVSANPDSWKREWPKTDFSKSVIDFEEVFSGGPPKDGIPAIDRPLFAPVKGHADLQDNEGVVSVEKNGIAKAYPIRILMWHEIVNDKVGGVPFSVTYCPLCNAAVVFERQSPTGEVLDFGTTGKLRNSDLIMYDRQTESWWQQFTGEAIVGDAVGQTLSVYPSRMESWASFKTRYPDGLVLVPNNNGMRDYGRNPYVGYSKSSYPFLYRGAYPTDIAPMAPVVIVGDKAWSLEMLKSQKSIETDGLLLQWSPGLASALEGGTVYGGEDLGIVRVTRDGQDVAYHHSFAFAFRAFYPQGVIVQE